MKKGNCQNKLTEQSPNVHIEKLVISSDSDKQLSFAHEKMIQTFGAPLLNTEGQWKNDLWENIWKRVVAMNGKMYSLPGGAVARQFV